MRLLPSIIIVLLLTLALAAAEPEPAVDAAAPEAPDATADKAKKKAAAPGLALMHNRLELNSLSFQELDEIFKQGTIDEGLPVGYSYGFVKIAEHLPPAVGYASNALWHGKKFELTSGENCPGKDCGQRGHISNELGAGYINTNAFMNGEMYIGHFSDVRGDLQALQLDEKPSVIVDYGNGGGDEIRLVNSKKSIYLGRGSDWGPVNYARIYCYFILQLYDEPRAVELSAGGVETPLVPSLGLPDNMPSLGVDGVPSLGVDGVPSLGSMLLVGARAAFENPEVVAGMGRIVGAPEVAGPRLRGAEH